MVEKYDGSCGEQYIKSFCDYIDISIKELAFKISDLLNYKGKIIWDKSKPDGTPRKKLDTTRLTNLGGEAKTDLQIGIRKTIVEFQKEIENNLLRK